MIKNKYQIISKFKISMTETWKQTAKTYYLYFYYWNLSRFSWMIFLVHRIRYSGGVLITLYRIFPVRPEYFRNHALHR